MPKSELVVIIPSYNEEDEIEIAVEDCFYITDSVLVIDDSTDGTAKLARKTGARVETSKERLGLGRSILKGLEIASKMKGVKRVAVKDIFSHLACDLVEMEKLLEISGADMIIGSRFIGGSHIIGSPWWRTAGSWIAAKIFSAIVRRDISDVTSGYRLYKAETIKSLIDAGSFDNIKTNSHAFQIELLYEVLALGKTVVESPIMYLASKSEFSKGCVKDLFRILLRIARRESGLF